MSALFSIDTPVQAVRHGFPIGDGAEILRRVAMTGILPTEDEQALLSADEQMSLPTVWRAGMERAADIVRDNNAQRFRARGWAFAWCCDHEPRTEREELLWDAIEAAIHVAEQYFPAIADHGLSMPEDMGLLQSKGCGGAEGVGVKRDPYGTLVLVSVYCVVGPHNFDPFVGTIEFEHGARSHVFHLVYTDLPSIERLIGDLAAHPLITSPANRPNRTHTRWDGEGWTGSNATRPHTHRPWDTLSQVEVKMLLHTVGATG